ncbi:PLP-dependent aminotransferase family protein [Flavobacterium sp. ANB]|uniref:MocR-like pyridoxine biosynthesis transcription factor PdxR n=1 Tax=unclassified Flavobacterium TaxID=196869 RepID=UPI0012BA142B|nr:MULTISPECIES: PLP-dependent aminotransferase family protein [unclassified Flavobacterium]MBF4515749.1 PLP-dependent aminotransferase family protein [Flavobacterium sp. ANB]MTD68752.1 aminotransferase class I/II-fold pyridoxal phosphate-dependent enzyme [Flavobacterium sp. LC2016-13]
MLPYKSLIQIDRNSSITIYIQVCNNFISLITNGTLQPSDILPSSRILAELIGINRNTVKLAYEELISQGWAESVERKGVFVLSKLPSISKNVIPKNNTNNSEEESFLWTNNFKKTIPGPNYQNTILTIDDGFPDVRLAPVDQLMREYRSLSRKFYGKSFLKYGSSKGSEHLRISISNYLSNTRGLLASPENILISKGSQMGIYLTSELLLNEGDFIAVGTSNYKFADDTFKHSGAKLIRIPVDENGMDIDYLENILQQQTLKAIYVIPHHHFPTTVTLSMERRLKLLNLAKEYRFAIIEDDYDFDFHYENKPYVPLASIDHNHNVIYIGSISKTFAPALRIGFMSGPPAFINAAASLREFIDKQGDTLLEDAFSLLFNNGEMERHFRKSLKIYKQRRNLFCEILQSDFKNEIQFEIPEGGLAVWSVFDKSIDLIKMSENALKNGLFINNGQFYKNESFDMNAMRIGFASLEEKEMIKAFEILKKSFY